MSNATPGKQGEITGLQLHEKSVVGKGLMDEIMRSVETGDDATKRILLRQWISQTNAEVLSRAKVHSSRARAKGVASNNQQLSAASEGGIHDKETENVSSSGFDDLEKDNGSS